MRDGKPIDGEMMVQIWPSSDSLVGLKDGDAVATPVIQRGPVRSGKFSVALDPAKVPAAFKGASGRVELQITVTDGQDEATWFTSALRSNQDSLASSGNRQGWVPASDRRSAKPDTVAFDLGRRTADSMASPRSKQVKLDGGTGLTLESTLAVGPKNARTWAEPVADNIVAAPTETCVTTAGSVVYNLPEYFAKVFAWSGAKGTVDFDTGSDHELGVGIGKSTGWSASGTSGISTGSGATVGSVVDANAVNRVNYRDYNNSCSAWTTRKPYNFYALIPGGQFTYAGHVNYSYCAGPYVSGKTVWKNQGTNITFGSGVDIGPINVSAQSGWNTGTKVAFTMTARTRVCGSSSSGWVSSPVMDARAY